MKVLLDTNVFVRWGQDLLPKNLLRRLEKSTTELLVSVVTPWEIAIKPELQFRLTAAAIQGQLANMNARLLPINLEHTGFVATLPAYHSDPFDRMIIAQALDERCPVVSSDERFPLYESLGLKVLWD